jgi:hypothetical protein
VYGLELAARRPCIMQTFHLAVSLMEGSRFNMEGTCEPLVDTLAIHGANAGWAGELEAVAKASPS